MARRFWTQARIAELRKLWSAGATAAAIGSALGGITRSAVLGKVFRLRLAPAARGRSALQASDDAPARRRAGKPAPQATRAKARPKTLFELTNECCRWPYGELGSRRFFFCGATGADVGRGIPYCPRHMARAYIVPPTLIKPLHQRFAGKFDADRDLASGSLPRQRESSGADPARSIFSGFPLSTFALRASADSKPAEAPPASVGGSRERAVTNKRKFG